MLLKRVLFYVFIIFILFSIFPGNVFAFTKKKNPPVKILLVPGHDNETWGSQYGNTKEADMNLVLATKIFNTLKKDKRFKVYITRDNLGYTTEFSNYFSIHNQEIISFEKESKKKLQDKISSGTFIEKADVHHVAAGNNMAVKLYGINKWANENKIDAVIHVHFNDYPRDDKWTKGVYKGFTIYMPEEQMANAKESTNLAKIVFTEIKKKYSPSNYEKELGGLVPDQSLIALGSNDTLIKSVRSILIEYGYIYRFGNNASRQRAYNNMSNLTIEGLKEYFFGK